MTEKSATDVLREKLTERGVKWRDESNAYVKVTTFTVNGIEWNAIDFFNSEPEWMILRSNTNITPEQAIAATLGSEREKALEKLVQKALDEGWCDEWWYEDALKLGLEANY